jgi:predicted nucleotidyltransferase
MPKKPPAATRYIQPYRYPSPNVPMSAIRRFARQIAQRFHPEKIILFGSYAYGTPHAESDVDLLVIMPANDVVSRAIRIVNAFDRDFSYDLIVRTPRQIDRGLKQNNWFLREIVEKGRVLYDARNGAVGPIRRGGHARSARNGEKKAATAKGLLLSAVGGKVPQGPATRARTRRSKDS